AVLDVARAKKEKAKKEKAKKEKAKKDKAKKDKAKKERAKKKKAEREKERQLQEQREVEEARQRDQTQAYSAIGALVGRIGAKVRENWNKPLGSMTGLETVISVKVQRTGEVVSVKVVKSSGDHFFDQSAENAVYKASPLPFPDEPRYYEFIKEFNFKFVPDGD
nr:cell envelope integrity protein TolA [Gammaproteobacteria bacterium]